MPVERVSPVDGETDTFTLDLEYILEREAKDPDYSIFSLMAGMTDKPRMTPLVEMARVIGSDLKSLAARGYTINEDLPEIVADCLKEVGFTQEAPASDSSVPETPDSEPA